MGDLDYLVATPDRRKRAQLCHVNMLKPYFRKKNQEGCFSSAKKESSLVLFFCRAEKVTEVLGSEPIVSTEHWEQNSVLFLEEKLQHLEEVQQREMLQRLSKYPSVFDNVLGRTTLIQHDIDVGESTPVKLPPYRVNPQKQHLVEKELEYMLEHGLIIGCITQEKKINVMEMRMLRGFCIDFRKANTLTKADTYSLPRMDDSVDRIGGATFISKVDLVKGY